MSPSSPKSPPQPETTISQSSNATATGSSVPLIEKLLNRLKSLKRGHSHHSHADSRVVEETKTTSAPSLACAPTEEVDETIAEVALTDDNLPLETSPTVESPIQENSTRKRGIDLAEYSNFCEELGMLLQNAREVQELSTFTGTYPSTLQRRLDQDALELRSLYNQVREALHNIVRVKEQRRAVRKERTAITKALTKIRDQEAREMEGLILQYDKALMSRWEKLKNTLQPEQIENFLHDIKGKKQALEHMNTIANQKLSQLNHVTVGSPTATTSSTISGSAPSGLLTATLRDENKAGSSSATNRRNSTSGCVRTNGMRWRKHHERGTRSASSSNGQEALPLSLIPLPLNPAPVPSLGITVIPLNSSSVTAATTTTSSTSNSLPSSPGSSIIPPNTPSAPPPNDDDLVFNIPGSSNELPGPLSLSGPACSAGGLLLGPTLPLMPERRSMLQALFGDLRRSTEIPNGTFVTLNRLGSSGATPSLGPISTAVVVTAPEDSLRGSNTESTNDQNALNGNTDSRNIELFSINRPT